jgi:hypothetical protein
MLYKLENFLLDNGIALLQSLTQIFELSVLFNHIICKIYFKEIIRDLGNGAQSYTQSCHRRWRETSGITRWHEKGT